MKYISNAFSLSMLDRGGPMPVITPVSSQFARHFATFGEVSSVVGHADTAAVMASALGADIPMNRVSLGLCPGDALLVGQYVGPRLPEGATSLPDGASLQWWIVRVPMRADQ